MDGFQGQVQRVVSCVMTGWVSNGGHYSGWYDRRSIGDFRNIIDVNFAAAMGPPGGGRNPVTPRLLRHFHYLAFTEMEDESKVV